MHGFRTERDSMGELQVPADALYGAQTQRAVQNFQISGRAMPAGFVRALGLVKAAAAVANRDLGLLDGVRAAAIENAARAIANGEHAGAFPVDVYQTGSGTSSNMNANEVIARLASEASGTSCHPNDHVNMGQSSNDVIPTALHVSAALAWHRELRTALDRLHGSLQRRAQEFADVAKTGRTHLMDAMPVTLGQEIGAWAAQIDAARQRLQQSADGLLALAIGGTAVGTGINAHPEFAERVAADLSAQTSLAFCVAPDRFQALSCQDAAVAFSGQLRALAVALMKIANDLRWMNSGPLAGLGEISLPALQPGSSIMPGKVNPVIPEAVTMVCARVMGNDATIGVAGQSGNFQLNVMLPVISETLLESIGLLANGATALATQAVDGFTVNQVQLDGVLARNPILVTALNAVIGYEAGAAIAKKAYAEGRPVLDVAEESCSLSRAELERLLDPRSLTRGGIVGGD
ncbi:class II fumarate hydratase [Methylonatrum kenyense]|uniref:class II fumarate hydratase n=1 Tax=Methylonatrum kenyense TaxID=455253 RepID=UPI0020C166B7|nr:class II fumarate hydratase [Methylonatrum kenyense]MCK8515794.1 class II fumarate hydratase [Methylonatrum kenyense]